MPYLIGGFALLCGVLLLIHLFINGNPPQVARFLKWTGIVLAAAAVVALVFARRLDIVLVPLAALMPILARLKSSMGGFRTASAGRVSTVSTAFLRMTLDHETGTMTGTVLRGRFEGMRLDELGPGDLLALLRETRAADEESARLLEAYLDRAHPAWQDELADERTSASVRGSDVSVEEAYAILGLSSDAGAEAIKAAHRRLMNQLHPDHGGTDYLATKINRARDVLLQQ